MEKRKRSREIIAEMMAPVPEDDDELEEEDEVLDFIEPGSEAEKEGIRFAKNTVSGMYLAFYLLSALCLVIGLLIFDEKLKFALGMAVGCVTGSFFIGHLNRSVRELLNYDENSATKQMKKDARLRLAVVGFGGVIAAAIIGGAAVYGILIQLMTLKLGIYLTPLTSGWIGSYNNKSKGGN